MIAVPVALYGFYSASRETVIAGHDAVVSPSADGYATADFGAYLPTLRYPTGQRVGVTIDVGQTNAGNADTLIERYALIASQPQGEVRKVRALLREMAFDAGFDGALAGLVGPALWLVIGADRRRQLLRRTSWQRGVALAATAGLVVTVAALRPWDSPTAPTNAEGSTWRDIGDLFPEAALVPEAESLQVQGGLVTSSTRRLFVSALDTYQTSLGFYEQVADDIDTVAAEIRQPAEGETVAILVSDRHDNVGMDQVSAAIAEEGGASIVFDAGDDTSTGNAWEAFSLDSLVTAFDGYAMYAVAGNHDVGDFVSDYLDSLGVNVLEGEAVDAPDGIRVLGDADPRSSGLGSWRDPTGVSFDERANDLADAACASDQEGQRVSTLLVHDVNLGRPALESGCVDLVLAGHLHTPVGPEEVVADDGRVGVRYTTGTTGGAAYAFALGSKLRRDAMVTLVTYRDGVPVGLQAVTVRTNGVYVVDAYVDLPGASP